MKDVVNVFLQHIVVARGFSQNTWEAYRTDLNQFLDFVVKRLEVSDDDPLGWRMVDLGLLTAYVSDLRDTKRYRSSTTARKVAAVRSFFGYLKSFGFISVDPTEDLGAPAVGRTAPQFLSESEVQHLLRSAAESNTMEGRRDANILEVLYASGVRVSELVALDVQDVDFDEGKIRAGSSGARDRIVYINPGTMSKIRQYIEGPRAALLGNKKGENALYVNNRGERLTRQWIWQTMKAAVEKSGINPKTTPNILRHSFAAHQLQHGSSLKHVQEMLGHSSISTTQMYAQVAVPNAR